MHYLIFSFFSPCMGATLNKKENIKVNETLVLFRFWRMRMIIKNKKYVIISNDYPLKFYTGDGCLDDFFEEAVLYESKEQVNGELSTFDEP